MTSETSSNPIESSATTSAFRSASEPATSEPLAKTNSDQPMQSTEKADGLFTGYEFDNKVPFIADFYGVKETFLQDPESYSEIGDITSYFENLITTGQLDNSTKAVEAKIKQLEKLSGVDATERVNMKLTRLAEYAKFENNINNAKRNSIKWSR
jgi:hypothetical protein